jgi:signal transduction histidine kinase
MNSLVNDMLVAARVEDSPVDAEREVTDLREVLETAVGEVMPRASKEHHLELRLPDRAVLARVDKERVVLALRNIIDNAVKYSPAGGDVVCSIDHVEGMAHVRVTDHGMGIAVEDRGRLFTRFGRVLTTANSHIPGIGLGLYFSREVARSHGGDVALVDGNGPGSTFELSLPISNPG